MENKIDDRLTKIENALIEQEHRITKIIPNLVKYGFDNTNPSKRNSVWKALLGYLLRRQAITLLIATTSGIVAIASLVIALQANNLFEKQNELILSQNNRIIQQTYLQEAERRSSLIFLMSNIMDKVDSELKDPLNTNRILSDELIGRIVSLSKGMRPYHYMENDSLIKKPLSPERGQLLIALVETKLDSTTMNKIFKLASFESADLKRAKLSGANLKGVNLFNASLTGAWLEDANLQEAELYGANLIATYLVNAKLQNARLQYCKGGTTILRGADLRGADLAYADLKGSDLIDVIFNQKTFLKDVILDDVKVNSKDWIQNLETSKGNGVTEILEKYKVVKVNNLPSDKYRYRVRIKN